VNISDAIISESFGLEWYKDRISHQDYQYSTCTLDSGMVFSVITNSSTLKIGEAGVAISSNIRTGNKGISLWSYVIKNKDIVQISFGHNRYENFSHSYFKKNWFTLTRMDQPRTENGRFMARKMTDWLSHSDPVTTQLTAIQADPIMPMSEFILDKPLFIQTMCVQT